MIERVSLHLLLISFLKFLGLGMVAAIPFLAVYCDLFILQTDLQTQSEQSIVEYTQSLFLLIMIGLFARNAASYPQYRCGFVLIAGFLLCMFIREMDQYLDAIMHSIWVYPALIVAFSCVLYALFRRQQATAGLLYFVQHRAYLIFVVGLVILLVTSRLLGSGFLWKMAMGEHYLRAVKHIIEECGELLGYSFMLLGTLTFSLTLAKPTDEQAGRNR